MQSITLQPQQLTITLSIIPPSNVEKGTLSLTTITLLKQSAHFFEMLQELQVSLPVKSYQSSLSMTEEPEVLFISSWLPTISMI